MSTSSLASLHHQIMPRVTVTTTTIAGVLDHIYTGLTSSVDIDGFAIAYPLTVTKRQNAGTTESLDFSTYTATGLGWKGQISGVNAVRTPLMSSSTSGSNTWLASAVLMGLTVNPGAYSAWDSATHPFTSGREIGLCQAFNASAKTAKYVYAVVSEESVWVFVEATDGTVWGGGIGALLDPHSTGSNSAESDGRRYCIITSGTVNAISAVQHTNTGIFPGHAASTTTSQALALVPGGTTCSKLEKLFILNAASTTTLTTPDSEPIALPLWFRDTVADRTIGELRRVIMVRDAKLNQSQSPGGTRAWWYMGSSSTADSDCLGFSTGSASYV